MRDLHSMFLAAASLNWEPLNFCVKINGMSCTCVRNVIMCTEIGSWKPGTHVETLTKISVCFLSPCLRVSPGLLLVSSPTCNPSSCPASSSLLHCGQSMALTKWQLVSLISAFLPGLILLLTCLCWLLSHVFLSSVFCSYTASFSVSQQLFEHWQTSWLGLPIASRTVTETKGTDFV